MRSKELYLKSLRQIDKVKAFFYFTDKINVVYFLVPVDYICAKVPRFPVLIPAQLILTFCRCPMRCIRILGKLDKESSPVWWTNVLGRKTGFLCSRCICLEGVYACKLRLANVGDGWGEGKVCRCVAGDWNRTWSGIGRCTSMLYRVFYCSPDLQVAGLEDGWILLSIESFWVGVFSLLYAWYEPLHSPDKGVLQGTNKGNAVC